MRPGYKLLNSPLRRPSKVVRGNATPSDPIACEERLADAVAHLCYLLKSRELTTPV